MKFSLLAVLLAKISMLTQIQPYSLATNYTEVSNQYLSNNTVASQINQSLVNIGNYKTPDVLSRVKREPKGGYSAGRSGGGRSSVGRSGRSYRGSYRSKSNSYTRSRSSYRVSKNYFTGKKWYNLNGKKVNLYKGLLYTKSGATKRFITTSKGIKYKIKNINNWLNIKTKDKFIISTLPKLVQYNNNHHLFKLAVCNFYFNYHWNKPLEMHLLDHKNNNPFKLSFIPNYEDKSTIDIGYYDINKPTNNFANSTVESNHTTTEAKTVRTFVKLASIPRGSHISFAVLNQVSVNNPISTTSLPKINNTEIADYNTTAEYNITSLPHNITKNNATTVLPIPVIINQNSTDINHMQNITSPINSTISYDANNITQVNSLLTQQNILNAHSQLVIMTDNNIIKKIPLPQKVDYFLINSNNDTILTYSMNSPKIERKRNNNNNWWHWGAATTGKDINYLLLSALALISAKSLF
jgi:ribosomal protein L35